MEVGDKLGSLKKEDAKQLPELIKDALNELKTIEIKFDQDFLFIFIFLGQLPNAFLYKSDQHY